MSHKSNVKKIYAVMHGKSYDFFRVVWTWLVSRDTEKRFNHLLKKNLNPKSKILDIGCGNGFNVHRLLRLKAQFKSYKGVDFSDDMLGIAKERYGKIKDISFAKKDVTKKIDDNKYDIIISTWVMSHLSNQGKLFNDLTKKLNKNGKMYFIFLTRPRWYINFWFFPFMWLFAAKYVEDEELDKIKSKKIIRKYAYGITTLLEVRK